MSQKTHLHRAAQESLSLVEQTTLPKISVRSQSGTTVSAYVNAYVVGKRPQGLTNGTVRTPLYYLSLVAMRGEGTTLQAIYSTLVSTHLRDVHLEGVGDVALAHHQRSLASNGYTIHWNYEQAEIQPTRDLHGVVESNMLTVCDPVRGMTVRQRVQRTSKDKMKRQKVAASLSTAKASKSQNSIEEIRNREKQPTFLLLVPSSSPDALFVQQLHLSFLDLRVPWPLDPSWASYLWERGLANGEIEPLTVWSAHPALEAGAGVEDLAAHTTPFLAEAYFCRPQPAQVQKALQSALIHGQIGSHLYTHLVALPPVHSSHDDHDELSALVVNA